MIMTEEKRRRYCERITSEEYIASGKPRNATRLKEEDAEFIEKALEEDRNNTKRAIKYFRQWKAKRKGPEYKIVFE